MLEREEPGAHPPPPRSAPELDDDVFEVSEDDARDFATATIAGQRRYDK